MVTHYIQAFIQNISFPTTLKEVRKNGGLFDIELILGAGQYVDEAVTPLCFNDGWTVPRWAKKGDIILFFHAKTANSRITRLITELDRKRGTHNLPKTGDIFHFCELPCKRDRWEGCATYKKLDGSWAIFSLFESGSEIKT